MFRKLNVSLPSKTQAKHFDWSLCILCQIVDNDRLVNPFNVANKGNRFQAYMSLESCLARLNDVGQLSSLPYEVNMSASDDRSGILHTLRVCCTRVGILN